MSEADNSSKSKASHSIFTTDQEACGFISTRPL